MIKSKTIFICTLQYSACNLLFYTHTYTHTYIYIYIYIVTYYIISIVFKDIMRRLNNEAILR